MPAALSSKIETSLFRKLLLAWVLFLSIAPRLLFPHDQAASVGDSGVFAICSQAENLKAIVHCGRPLLAALYFRVIGTDEHAVLYINIIISIACWVYLAMTMASFVSTKFGKFSITAAILLTPAIMGFYVYDAMILADSLSASLTAAVTAAFFSFIFKPSIAGAVTCGIITMMFGLVRDTNTYTVFVLAIAIATLSTLLWLRGKWARPLAIAATILFVNFGLFSLMPQPVGLQQRWVFPMLNDISQFVLPDPASIEFFSERGMPLSDNLLSLKGKWASSDGYKYFVDPNLQPFRDFITSKGKFTYQLWLVETLPSRLNQFYHHGGFVFRKWRTFADAPVLNVRRLLIFTAIIGMAVVFLRNGRGPLVAGAALLCALGLIHGFIVYWGDAMEWPRHGLDATEQLCIALAIMVGLGAESVAVIVATLQGRLSAIRSRWPAP